MQCNTLQYIISKFTQDILLYIIIMGVYNLYTRNRLVIIITIIN